MPLTKIKTQDGSDSFFSEEFQDTYHSQYGALQEARHIFVQAGFCFLQQNKKELRVFEMGFGTGLNAFLTCLAAEIPVQYTAVEAYPLEKEFWQTLNYAACLPEAEALKIFTALHAASWEKDLRIRPHFTLHKIRALLEDIRIPSPVDLVYFDAFAPDAQPELWTENIFAKLYAALTPGGVLVTYSAKGAVRRALEAAGFRTERLPGPPGKREFLRALK